MSYPDFMRALPALDVPFPQEVVSTYALAAPQGLAVFFEFHQDMTLPPHSHGDQWGTVLAGEIEFTIGGETRTYTPGMSYFIPAGTEHGAQIKAGTRAMDMFAEADRYPLKG